MTSAIKNDGFGLAKIKRIKDSVTEKEFQNVLVSVQLVVKSVMKIGEIKPDLVNCSGLTGSQII